MSRGRKTKDLTGLRVGRLTVVKRGPNRNNRTTWICQCDCGNVVQKWAYNLARDRPKSCGCWPKARRPENKKQYSKKGKPRWVPSPEAAMGVHQRNYMQGATNRDIEWKLTEAQFEALVTANCFYCGTAPKDNGHHLGDFNGIDRIDSSKDYTWDNCVPCCKTCNYAKQSLSRDEFIQWIGRAFMHLHEQGLLNLEV